MPNDPIFDGLNYGVDFCIKNKRWLGAAEVWHVINDQIVKLWGEQ